MGINVLKQEKLSFRKVISGTSLIAGTTIGAGMLGIPLVTAKAGFVPALGITLIAWLFMVLTGLLYLEVALAMPNGANIFSMAGRYLGSRGRWAAGAMFLFLYYCLIVAYYAGGAPLLGYLFSSCGIALDGTLSVAVFGLIFGGIVLFGARAIDRVVLMLTVGLILSYFLLVSMGSAEVSIAKLQTASWSNAWLALPVLFSAFGYHNVVPSLCTYLERDRKSLKLAILCGTGIALAVYLIWQWLILGSLSQEAIVSTLKAGQPATQALQSLTGKNALFAIGQVFAFFALTTSLLGVSFSVVDFLNDGLKWNGSRRPLLVLLAFLPPGICAALDPSIFETALGVAGGIGEAFLNGLLPTLLAWKYRSQSKDRLFSQPFFAGTKILIALIAFSLVVMGIEVFHLLK